jgi:hypothetical protein
VQQIIDLSAVLLNEHANEGDQDYYGFLSVEANCLSKIVYEPDNVLTIHLF